MRDDQRNYIVVGVFVLAMLAGLVMWIVRLTGAGPTDAYYVRFDAVTGLAEGAQVTFNGYPIGKIESIEHPNDGNAQRFRLKVNVEQGWKIPNDSEATIVAGILAAVLINIEGGDSTTFLDPDDQIPSAESPDLIAFMTEFASDVRETVDTLKPEIEGIVSNFNRTIDQVGSLLSQENTQRIAAILENLEVVSQEIERMATRLGSTPEQLDRVLSQVDHVLAQTSDLIAENEGELSQSIVDLHESLEALARHAEAIASNLEVTTRNMNEFSQQIRQDPGVIIRGRSAADDPAGSN
jgi:phospholipid/cholesterol/gamma-HCH transport system substrate-binding protein